MSDLTLTETGRPGSIPVLSARLVIPWRGVPVIDCELDPAVLRVPMGKVTLTLAGSSVSATVDPRGSGQFVEFIHVRLIAGAAGWDKVLPARPYDTESGVSSADVITTTANEVGEKAEIFSPVLYPAHYERSQGPASRVLGAFDWWVDVTGVTQVGTRPILAADPSITLIRWDPTMQMAELTSDVIVLPGTQITDARLPGGTVTVRDVEQKFDGEGSHVQAWCGINPVSQFMNDLRALVEEFSGRKTLATYLYRMVDQDAQTGRLQLQLVNRAEGMPDAGSISPWGGPGDSAVLRPGSLLRLSFFAGDPGQPIVDSYEPGVLPLERTLDAEAIAHIGPSAAVVEIAAGKIPMALGTPIVTFLTALQTWTASVASALLAAGQPIVGPQAALVAAIAAASSDTPAKKIIGQ